LEEEWREVGMNKMPDERKREEMKGTRRGSVGLEGGGVGGRKRIGGGRLDDGSGEEEEEDK
jgi:hypothetical protein